MRNLSLGMMVSLGTLAAAPAYADDMHMGHHGAAVEMTAPDMVVMFKSSDSALQTGTEASLNELSDWLILSNDNSVVITADSAAGTSVDVATARADLLKDYLVRRGVSPSQIHVVAMGEPVPMHDNQRILVTTDRTAALTPKAEVDVYQGDVNHRMATSPTVIEETKPAKKSSAALTGVGLSFTAGGGPTGFVDQTARDVTDIGAGWEARVGIGNSWWLGGEAAYIGSWNGMRGRFENVANNVDIYGNGVEGDLRINFTKDFPVQPYAFGGAGWTHYNVQNDGISAGNTLVNNDDVLQVPVGAGVATKIGPALLDVRGTFRAAFDNDLMQNVTPGGNPELHTWSAVARLGFNI